MTDLILSQNTPATTMTSLEISELVESRHDKVKQSIERLAERGVISLPPMGEVKVQRERREETISVYLVGKRDSYIIVAQLSPEFTARLVDRWQELEARPAYDPANLTRIQILQMAIESESARLKLVEEKATLEAKIEADAPKVEFTEEVTIDEKTNYSVRQVAKILNEPEKAFRAWLAGCSAIFKNPDGSWEPYAAYIKRGWFALKVEKINGRIIRSPAITGDGLFAIRNLRSSSDMLKHTPQIGTRQ